MNKEEVVEILRKENDEFRQLEEEHRSLEERLAELENKHFLTTEDEVEVKAIKKQKLIKKDRMAELIREFRKTATLN